MVVVLAFTTFPLLSEALAGEEATVGPPFYNRWMVPFGIVLLILAGVGPLISWRKATGKNLARAFTIPTITAVVFALLHVALGSLAGFPPYVESPELYTGTWTGAVLQAVYGVAPVAVTFACSFVTATIAQEFWRGTRVRMRTKNEDPFMAFARLVARARRRYGGYVVHMGIVLMFVGFAGAAYDYEQEAALRPEETMEVKGYVIRYERARTVTDPNKRAIFTDLTVMDADGDVITRMSPAKFIYRTHPEMPTTEVAIRSTPYEDVYAIMSTVDPATQRATFRIVVRPLVMWIWIGTLVLILGTIISVFPSTRKILGPDRRGRGKGAAAAAALLLALGLGIGASAEAQDSSSLHAGTVVIEDPEERMLFERLLCMCGDCQRLTLANCGCGWAETARADLREQMARGASVAELQEAYRAEHGPKSISIPEDAGLGRALWAVPVAGAVVALGVVVFVGRKWSRRDRAAAPGEAAAAKAEPEARREGYDAQLDEELRRMEES
jgi:cytochrome c-type biogenesis protein CcmF